MTIADHPTGTGAGGTGPTGHPVVTAATMIDAALAEAAGCEPVFLDPAGKREALVRLTQLCDRLVGLRLKVIAASAEVGVDGRISASEARRLACTANLIPAVLGSKSQPLDLGRTARLFSPAQRKAVSTYACCGHPSKPPQWEFGWLQV